jgi:hypothetical protein
LLLSKFLATLLLGLSLAVMVGAIAIATQILKGDNDWSRWERGGRSRCRTTREKTSLTGERTT